MGAGCGVHWIDQNLTTKIAIDCPLPTSLSFQHLQLVKAGVESALTEQFFVATGFNQLTTFEHKDAIAVANGRQTMGNNNRSAVFLAGDRAAS